MNSLRHGTEGRGPGRWNGHLGMENLHSQHSQTDRRKSIIQGDAREECFLKINPVLMCRTNQKDPRGRGPSETPLPRPEGKLGECFWEDRGSSTSLLWFGVLMFSLPGVTCVADVTSRRDLTCYNHTTSLDRSQVEISRSATRH